MHIVLALALLAAGGATLLSSRALPGNPFYSVKTTFAETARAMLATTDEAKAEVAMGIALDRLEEAERLAGKGKMNAEARMELLQGFNMNVRRVSDQIADLKKKGEFDKAAAIGADFEAALRAHWDVLGNLNMAPSDKELSLTPFINDVRAAYRRAEAARADAEGRAVVADPRERAERELLAAELAVEETKARLAGMKAAADGYAAFDAEMKLAEAEKSVLNGRMKLAKGGSNEAALLFRSASRLAREARLNAELASEFYPLGGEAAATLTTANMAAAAEGSLEGEAKLHLGR